MNLLREKNIKSNDLINNLNEEVLKLKINIKTLLSKNRNLTEFKDKFDNLDEK